MSEADFEHCSDPGLCVNDTGDNDSKAVAFAFLVTLGAGLSTTIGATAPWWMEKLMRSGGRDTRVLAVALGLSAGVMLYVSFVEIFSAKAVDYLCCVTDQDYLAATACFFGGMILTVLLHLFVEWMASLDMVKIKARATNTARYIRSWSSSGSSEKNDGRMSRPSLAQEVSTYIAPEHMNPPPAPAEDNESTMTSSDVDNFSESETERQEQNQRRDDSDAIIVEECNLPGNFTDSEQQQDRNHHSNCSMHRRHVSCQDKKQIEDNEAIPLSKDAEAATEAVDSNVTSIQDSHSHMLKRMGLMTALAIFIHNIPEGLATFVATLADPSLGVALAVAVALHNIPEGICVAMPVYYATGSKWKGFWWAFLSGVSEPVGALLGYLVLKDYFIPEVYGIIFGLVAGMMVYISISELIPTAIRYDPTNKLVAPSIAAGMLLMAISLVLFVV
eukprot:Clim_evm31s146 gene=Clim_evmTU31s146